MSFSASARPGQIVLEVSLVLRMSVPISLVSHDAKSCPGITNPQTHKPTSASSRRKSYAHARPRLSSNANALSEQLRNNLMLTTSGILRLLALLKSKTHNMLRASPQSQNLSHHAPNLGAELVMLDHSMLGIIRFSSSSCLLFHVLVTPVTHPV